MILAAIFDLDNCLAPARAVGEPLFQPVFDAIRNSNEGTLPQEELEKALEALWGNSLDWVAEKYGFSEAMRDAGWELFKELDAPAVMNDYDDIGVIADLPVKRFLVTSGFRRLQEGKIAALNLRPMFDAVFVDAIDEPRLGKKALFTMIMESHKLDPTEIIVVGDNEASELEAGNQLGMRTVQILRPGVEETPLASHHIRSLPELEEALA